MNSIRAIKELNKRELEHAVSTSASWHNDYRDTAFIYVGGIPLQLSEGDIVTIFSQYGDPNYINLVRDKETGKSKGFCFLKYEDQRSCDLAVDNLGGASLMGKLLSVDHTRYKSKDDEEIFDNTNGVPDADAPRLDDPDSESDTERPLLKEERELQKLKLDHDDDDPMKTYLIEQKQDEVKAALQRYEHERRKSASHTSKEHRHRHRHHRGGDDKKEHRRRHHRHASRSKSPRDEGERERRERRSRRPSASPADEERRRHHRDRRQRRDRSRSTVRPPKDRFEDK